LANLNYNNGIGIICIPKKGSTHHHLGVMCLDFCYAKIDYSVLDFCYAKIDYSVLCFCNNSLPLSVAWRCFDRPCFFDKTSPLVNKAGDGILT